MMQEQLNGKNKHNFIRENITSARLKHSETMVITAEPRLDIDQIGMSFDAARKLSYFPKNIRTERDARREGYIQKDGCLNTEKCDGALILRDPVYADQN